SSRMSSPPLALSIASCRLLPAATWTVRVAGGRSVTVTVLRGASGTCPGAAAGRAASPFGTGASGCTLAANSRANPAAAAVFRIGYPAIRVRGLLRLQGDRRAVHRHLVAFCVAAGEVRRDLVLGGGGAAPLGRDRHRGVRLDRQPRVACRAGAAVEDVDALG